MLGLGCRRRDLDHDVGRLAADLGLKSFLRVGGVRDGADESVRVNHGVAALDHVSVTLLLAVLVVGELIVLHVETELVRRVGLDRMIGETRTQIVRLVATS